MAGSMHEQQQQDDDMLIVTGGSNGASAETTFPYQPFDSMAPQPSSSYSDVAADARRFLRANRTREAAMSEPNNNSNGAAPAQLYKGGGIAAAAPQPPTMPTTTSMPARGANVSSSSSGPVRRSTMPPSPPVGLQVQHGATPDFYAASSARSVSFPPTPLQPQQQPPVVVQAAQETHEQKQSGASASSWSLSAITCGGGGGAAIDSWLLKRVTRATADENLPSLVLQCIDVIGLALMLWIIWKVLCGSTLKPIPLISWIGIVAVLRISWSFFSSLLAASCWSSS